MACAQGTDCGCDACTIRSVGASSWPTYTLPSIAPAIQAHGRSSWPGFDLPRNAITSTPARSRTGACGASCPGDGCDVCMTRGIGSSPWPGFSLPNLGPNLRALGRSHADDDASYAGHAAGSVQRCSADRPTCASGTRERHNSWGRRAARATALRGFGIPPLAGFPGLLPPPPPPPDEEFNPEDYDTSPEGMWYCWGRCAIYYSGSPDDLADPCQETTYWDEIHATRTVPSSDQVAAFRALATSSVHVVVHSSCDLVPAIVGADPLPDTYTDSLWEALALLYYNQDVVEHAVCGFLGSGGTFARSVREWVEAIPSAGLMLVIGVWPELEGDADAPRVGENTIRFQCCGTTFLQFLAGPGAAPGDAHTCGIVHLAAQILHEAIHILGFQHAQAWRHASLADVYVCCDAAHNIEESFLWYMLDAIGVNLTSGICGLEASWGDGVSGLGFTAGRLWTFNSLAEFDTGFPCGVTTWETSSDEFTLPSEPGALP